jgi:hypothetical protein
MPAAEIAAAITGLRSALDITKAMVGLRDAEAFRTKSIELQSIIMDAYDKGITAREAQSEQLNRIGTLEAEVARLKNWDAEKDNYELKKCGEGSVAFMLKPNMRGSEPPHWLCPNCFSNRKKSFLNSTGASQQRGWVYKCSVCSAQPSCYHIPAWDQTT